MKCRDVIQESWQIVKYVYNGAKLYIRKLTQDDMEVEAMKESKQDPDYLVSSPSSMTRRLPLLV